MSRSSAAPEQVLAEMKSSGRPAPSLGRLLVVDDEPELLASLCERLAKQGYEAVGFSSAREALEALPKQEFDLLLTDVMMPDMDGLALLRAAQGVNPQLVCVMMTGQGTIQTAVEALKLGALDYLLKPFKMQMLLPVLTRALEVRRLRLEVLQLRETVAIHELCQAISYTLDLNTLLNRIVEAALHQCEADEASILLPSPEGDELYLAVARGGNREALLGERVPLTCSIAGWVARSREPLVLQGEVPDPRFVPFRPRSDIKAAIFLPMLAGGKLVGVLNVSATHRRSFAMGQVKALNLLASAGAAALEGTLLYADLKRQEEKYRSVFESVADGIFRITPTGRFALANPAMARILGYPSAEELLAQITDIAQQLYLEPERWAANRQQLEKDGGWHTVEDSLRRKDGSPCWLSVKARAVRDGGGTVLYYEGTAEDVSERRKMEEMLGQRARLAMLSGDVGLVLTRSTTLREMLQGCTEALVRHLEVAFARIWTLDAQENVLVLQASAGASAHLDGAHSRVPVGRYKIGLIAQERKPHLTNDVRNDPGVSDPEWARREGMVAFAGHPLLVGSRLLGVLAMFARKPLAESTLETLGFLADGIGLAIDRLWGEHALRETNWTLEALVESAPLAIIAVDREGKVQMWNPAAEKMFGWGRGEVLGRPNPALLGDSQEEFRQLGSPGGVGGPSPPPRELGLHSCRKVTGVETQRQKRDGSRINVAVSAAPLLDANGEVRGFMSITADISERQLLEEQLRQAQKMEAVGRLAGGVAHDFNNLLTVISGFSELVLGKLRPDDSSHGLLREVLKAGERAAGLTRQLLAFSRKQVVSPEVIFLNATVKEMEKMLRRLLGEDVTLAVVASPDLAPVKVDVGQFEQVLMNLAVNARDAMPQGGQLTIETRNVELDAVYARQHSEVRPGLHVLVAVRDTGCGMDAATTARIFEPFFTTKGPDKGTGLGLATVYGIVKQAGGHIEVESEVGKGTTFKIYLPPVGERQAARTRPSQFQVFKGTETVMLVEDQAEVRDLIRLALQASGYTVLEATDGSEALQVCKEHQGPIHLLLTDVIMPKMSGRQLAQLLAPLRPDLKVLFMSGYTDDAITRHGVLETGLAFLQKPFSPTILARKVREVLDQQREPQAS